MSNRYRRVCVVGGGPAGLAAAIALRCRNREVTVVGCAVPPIDKACGEGLMPDSLKALRELGIEVPLGIGFPFRGIRVTDKHASVAADFPNGLAKGVRRTALHHLLVSRAEQAGVTLIWRAKHVRLADEGVHVGDRFIASDLIVGADGQNSSMRRQAGLDKITLEKRRYGFRQHYHLAPWSEYVEVHWGANCQVYVTPVSADEVSIATISRDPKIRLDDALCDNPKLTNLLSQAQPCSTVKGSLSVSRALKCVCRRNVALVGDASGSVDAITGEGICVSFKQAQALGDAVEAGDLREYEAQHKRLMRRPRTMAALLLLLDRSAHLQRRALGSLAECPGVFRTLLGIHVGAAEFSDLFSWTLIDLGRAFLAA
jgi:flavin-dependent dehydrogenase